MKKRLIPLILALILTLSIIPTPAAEATQRTDFADLPGTHWVKENTKL